MSNSPKSIEEIIHFYEGNSCMDAMAIYQLPHDATVAQKIEAMQGVINWYETHSTWIVQKARNDLAQLWRENELNTPLP